MFKYAGLTEAIKYLEETTPARRQARTREERLARDAEKRAAKREMDLHCAALVAERKQRIGW